MTSKTTIPDIFGVNIDGGKIFIWTSQLDKEKKYLIDVYDQDLNYLCTTSYYNVIGQNVASIKNGRLCCPNIGSDSIDIKNSIGRFGLFNEPYRLDVFQISKKNTLIQGKEKE